MISIQPHVSEKLEHIALHGAVTQVEVIKKEGPIQDKEGYWEMLESFSEEKEHAFLKKNMHRLRKPIKVPAGTTWVAKSSSGSTKGMFKEDCRRSPPVLSGKGKGRKPGLPYFFSFSSIS